MSENRETLEGLFQSGEIALVRSAFLDQTPEPLASVRRKKHGLRCFVEQTWHEWTPKIGGERESGRFRESGTT
jgi:hypothetical protein